MNLPQVWSKVTFTRLCVFVVLYIYVHIKNLVYNASYKYQKKCAFISLHIVQDSKNYNEFFVDSHVLLTRMR